MKKLLILTTTLLTGGLILPVAAKPHCGHSSSSKIFVSGYSSGSPIYSKRVYNGHHYRNQRLSGYELQRYLTHQRRLTTQRELARRLAKAKYKRSANYRQAKRR